MSEIDKDIKTKRKELGLSQLDVAMIIGVTRVTYVKYEQDPSTMPIGKYEQLMQELARLRELRIKEDK